MSSVIDLSVHFLSNPSIATEKTATEVGQFSVCSSVISFQQAEGEQKDTKTGHFILFIKQTNKFTSSLRLYRIAEQNIGQQKGMHKLRGSEACESSEACEASFF